MRISDWSSDVCSSDLGRLRLEVQADFAGRAVTRFCDDDFGEAEYALHFGRPFLVLRVDLHIVALDRALGLARGDIIILAEHEEHHVGVLLERSRLAKVGELRDRKSTRMNYRH